MPYAGVMSISNGERCAWSDPSNVYQFSRPSASDMSLPSRSQSPSGHAVPSHFRPSLLSSSSPSPRTGGELPFGGRRTARSPTLWSLKTTASRGYRPRSGCSFPAFATPSKLPKVRLHDLRHSYASLLLQSGADLKVVSTALGHSSVAITADIYAHVSPVMLQSAANRLDALIESGRKVSGQLSTRSRPIVPSCSESNAALWWAW